MYHAFYFKKEFYEVHNASHFKYEKKSTTNNNLLTNQFQTVPEKSL